MYDNVFGDNAEITILNPEGDHAVACFWLRRESRRVQRAVRPTTAVVGNVYYDAFGDPIVMGTSAFNVYAAMMANPQISHLSFVGNDVEIDRMVAEINSYGLPVGNRNVDDGIVTFTLGSRTKTKVEPPEVKPPTTFPYKYPDVHVIRHTSLSELHAAVLRHVLTYGTMTTGDKARLEVTNLVANWLHPFDLGGYSSYRQAWNAYVSLMPDPSDEEDGKDLTKRGYTYRSRLNRAFAIQRKEGSRRSWFPIWIPGDETHRDPPCLLGVYLRGGNVTGVFRAHHLVDAWPKNMWLLRSLLPNPGSSVTCVSMQAGIRPDQIDRAKIIAACHEARPDIQSNGGAWKIYPIDGYIVAELHHRGAVIRKLTALTSERIRAQLTRLDAWPDDKSECGYIGDHLAQAEAALRPQQEKTDGKDHQ